MFVRWSKYLLPTRKDAPTEAHPPLRLMLQAGLIRRLGPGIYGFLPLASRALERIEGIVGEEVEAIGALRIGLPHLQPTGGPPGSTPGGFRLTDAKGREFVLGPSGARAAVSLVAGDINSWRDLPVVLYRFGHGYRDAAGHWAREFPLHEAFSFCADQESLEETYRHMARAYSRVLARCGLAPKAVKVPDEAPGEESSLALVVLGDKGEEEIAVCASCGYAADRRLARAKPPAPPPGEERALELVETPGVRTVEGLVGFLGVSPDQVVKTFLYVGKKGALAALVRGDHELEEEKLRRAIGDHDMRRVDHPDEAREIAGAPFGYLGPIGLSVPIWADEAVRDIPAAVVGANREGYHYVGAKADRDFKVEGYLDLRRVREGDLCGQCGAPLRIKNGIKVAELYTGAAGTTFSDRDGRTKPVLLGRYTLELHRILEAVVERHHDDAGIIWPVEIAPLHVAVVVLRPDVLEQMEFAERTASALANSSLEVLLDDRDRSPGEKFHDAKLIGAPVMLVVGPRALKRGEVEAERRWDGARASFPAEPAAVVEGVRELLRAECS